jgi:hypothetical protein
MQHKLREFSQIGKKKENDSTKHSGILLFFWLPFET